MAQQTRTQQAPHEQMKAIDSGVIEAVVAVYDSHDRAEQAVRDVQKAGFDMRKKEIKAGKFVVIAHGTAHELGAIRDTLGTGSQQFRPSLSVAA